MKLKTEHFPVFAILASVVSYHQTVVKCTDSDVWLYLTQGIADLYLKGNTVFSV
jgi:hypothetical protein